MTKAPSPMPNAHRPSPKAKTPVAYSGTGSAIDNYFSDAPKIATAQEGSAYVNSPPLEELGEANWAFFDKNNPKQKVIRSLMHQLQWVKPSEKWGEIPDLESLSNFLKSDKSPVKKPLKKMAPQELEKIIKALNGIILHKYKSQAPQTRRGSF